jgi:fibronectin-binding protein A (FbpA)/ribosomal quality control pathway NFACT family protein
VSGDRDRRLWLDAGPGTAGVYLLTRDEARRTAAATPAEAAGSTRHALLLFRKHLSGARVTGLRRVDGERTVVLESGAVLVALRLRGASPAATLVVEGTALATFGGPAAWPLPAADPARRWDAIAPETLEAAAREARDAGRPVHRALAAACPELGPLLARELDGSPASLEALRARLHEARPTLLAPTDLEACDDVDLASPDAVALAPVALPSLAPVARHPGSWREAAAVYVAARYRGQAFASRRRAVLAAAHRDALRLSQLEENLSRDLSGMPEADELRRRAEALLASPGALPPGAAEADVPDPRDPDERLRFAVDPALTGPANADRLFEKARRIDRARLQVRDRLGATHTALAAARARASAASTARNLADLGPDPGETRAATLAPANEGRGPRRYLTGRGLTILVGRGARENHHLTFAVARPEDLWLHARDVPGAHVILRDDEGRAGPDDIREAAEVAAFFSEARRQPRADVHVARCKHLRAAGGGPGRVRVGHSENVRVAPRDPEGRLRQR